VKVRVVYPLIAFYWTDSGEDKRYIEPKTPHSRVFYAVAGPTEDRSLVVLRVLVHAVQFPLVRHSCRFADINDTYSPSVFPAYRRAGGLLRYSWMILNDSRLNSKGTCYYIFLDL
jgi:hypothetical protein